MSTWINSLKEFTELVAKYEERAKNNNMSNKDRGSMLQLVGDYYEMFNTSEINSMFGDELRDKITSAILEIQKSIENENYTEIVHQRKNLLDMLQKEEAAEKSNEILSEIFQKDISEMEIHNEKINVCQNLVDLDMVVYGRVTEKTLQVLEVQNVTIVNGRVEEKMASENVASLEIEGDVIDQMKGFVEQHKADLQTDNSELRSTLIVNAYAGPGAGKTTACLAAVAELKKKGYVAEYVSEYAKELVYDNPDMLNGTPENQFAILKEQTRRLDRFMGNADIIVTDSPILLNTIYGKDLPEGYSEGVKQLYDQYANFNFFVNRGQDFEQEGRIQNREESIQKDEEIKKLLKDNELFFGTYNHETVSNLASKIEITYKRLFKNQEKGKPVIPKQENPNKEKKGGEKGSIDEKVQAYKGTVYENGHSKNRKRWSRPIDLYEASPEAILTRVQGWNRARSEEKQFGACYIRKFNSENNKYENPVKYDVKTGVDVTPIYLNLPHLPTDEYKKLISELVKNGARRNPITKAFFVTKLVDLNQFRDYLPIIGTQAEIGENRSRNELPYEIESGSDYYDNRVKITIEGMEPINIYGDSYDVHFPSLSAIETKEIVEKFVLPGIEPEQRKEKQEQVEYNGKTYNRSQYNVIVKAKEQHFTKEQLQMLERPELTSDRLNEIRFAIKDGLSAEQIAQFATMEHEQWQMDLCRIGMQHGFNYNDLKNVIDPNGYTKEQWGDRRNMLARMVKEKTAAQRPSALKKLRENEKVVIARETTTKENERQEKARNTPIAEK